MPTAAQERKIVEEHIRPAIDPSDWVAPSPGDELYSPNQMIGAWQAGQRHGVESLMDLYERTLEDNMEYVGELTRKIVSEIQSRGFNPLSARLKVYSWNGLEVLIGVPSNEFYSDNFADLFEFTSEIENSATTERGDTLSVSFHLIGQGAQFDLRKVISDGYIYPHTLFADAPGTRPA